LTSQSKTDFGYIFHAGLFQRILTGGEDAVAKDSTVVAVLSCGFLRLLNWNAKATQQDPWQPVDFDPSHGQLQLDVAQYEKTPKIVRDEQGWACLDIYSNYVPGPRQVTNKLIWKSTADEKLCGNATRVKQLSDAIHWQVYRFRVEPNKTAAWNYGTHDEGKEPQYELKPGEQAFGLDEVVSELWASHPR